jgi:hypothetical protein
LRPRPALVADAAAGDFAAGKDDSHEPAQRQDANLSGNCASVIL